MNSADLELLRGSDLFDAEWYLQQHPDVSMLKIEAEEHYLWLGARLGRNPSPNFDGTAYLARNPDVRKADVNPLIHFIRWGQFEGRIAHPVETKPAKPIEPPSEPPTSSQTSGLRDNLYSPHFGIHFHRLMTSARGRFRSIAASEEYASVRDGLDLPYYLTRYPDIARARRLDPIDHYLKTGIKEGRDPTPEFSTRYYLSRYPDVREAGIHPFHHWLTAGKKEGRIAAPYADFEAASKIVGQSPENMQDMLREKRRDLRERLESGRLGEMVARAATLEPLIAHTWWQALQAKIPPFHSDSMVGEMVALHGLHEAAGFRRAAAVVVLPHCRLSGAGRLAGSLARTLADIYGEDEIVILRTDLSVMRFPEWFPAKARHVDFFAATEKLNARQREKLLLEFLRALRPRAVFNVNSRLFWDLLTSHGKALSATVPLYAYFFCNDRTIAGHETGYPIRMFYRHFDVLSAAMTDSHALADEFRNRYLVAPDQAHRVVTLDTPVTATPPPAPAPAGNARPQIFWAGRFDRQKRLDIVYAIARAMPEAEFHLWGEPVLDEPDLAGPKPDNVFHEGVYGDLGELPLQRCDVWLYTSEWDGVPNTLIEIATLAIPLVGSLAGGTGEILREGLSVPVTDVDDVDAYVAGIRTVLSDPAAARRRAGELRAYVLKTRTRAAYREAIETMLERTGAG